MFNANVSIVSAIWWCEQFKKKVMSMTTIPLDINQVCVAKIYKDNYMYLERILSIYALLYLSISF